MSKVLLEVERMTGGFVLTINEGKGPIKSFIFETSTSMSEFIRQKFDNPFKPKTIRRPRKTLGKTLSDDNLSSSAQ